MFRFNQDTLDKISSVVCEWSIANVWWYFKCEEIYFILPPIFLNILMTNSNVTLAKINVKKDIKLDTTRNKP